MKYLVSLKQLYIKFWIVENNKNLSFSLKLAIAFFALISVSMAQIFLQPEIYLTEFAEIARDGHSRVVDRRFVNPVLNTAFLNRGPLNGGLAKVTIYDILKK